MMLHAAATKSTVSSALRWSSKPSIIIGRGSTTARRTFFTPKSTNYTGKKNGTFSSSADVGSNNQLVRMSSTLINKNINYYYYDGPCIASSAIAGGGPGRSPYGNPSTMAFLGLRAKSSGAAFRHHIEDEGDDDADVMMYDAATGGGIAASGGNRSNYQEWMVNLGRGDDEWLSKPRSGEWFTGLEPSICPGELYVCTILLYYYVICINHYIFLIAKTICFKFLSTINRC